MENREAVERITALHGKYPLLPISLHSADVYLTMLVVRALKEF